MMAGEVEPKARYRLSLAFPAGSDQAREGVRKDHIHEIEPIRLSSGVDVEGVRDGSPPGRCKVLIHHTDRCITSLHVH